MSEFEDADSALERTAQAIEEPGLTDLRGVMAKRKRDREDAELRRQVREECRKEFAERIREFKSDRNTDAVEVLRRLADLPENADHTAYLTDAWPIAWKGWVNIECTIICNSNWVPPQNRFKIRLTDEGRHVLADSLEDSLERTDGGKG